MSKSVISLNYSIKTKNDGILFIMITIQGEQCRTCGDKPHNEYAGTGYCGKHQPQGVLAGIPRAMNRTQVMALAEREANFDRITEYGESYGTRDIELPNDVEAGIEAYLEELVEFEKQSISEMIWDNEPTAFREGQEGVIWDSNSPELIDLGNSEYIPSIDALGECIEEIEERNGSFSFKIADGSCEIVSGDVDEEGKMELGFAIKDVQSAMAEHREHYLGLAEENVENRFYDEDGFGDYLETLSHEQLRQIAENCE